jgi:hypothetical protein
MTEEQIDRKPEPITLGPGMISASRRSAYQGTGDKRPMVYRPGSNQAAALPSRVGKRLHYPDGRVETINE